MNPYAVNIGLIPPKEVVQLAISLNKALRPFVENEISLSEKMHFPHITLFHARVNNIDELKRVVEEIAKGRKSIVLEIQDLVCHRLADQKTTSLKISFSKELAQLRNKILEKSMHLLSKEISRYVWSRS